MSDWIIDRSDPNNPRLRFWNSDVGYEVQVQRLSSTDGYQLNIEWHEDVGNHQEEHRSGNAYCHGRNLEVLRAFLMEPVVSNLLQENGRLHDLLQKIKYQARGLGDFEKKTPLGEWISEQITDKDAGW